MSISTYSELQTAVAGWLKRADMTAQIPDFIRLAEVRIKSLMDVQPLDVTVSLATAPSVDTVALPADYKTPIALWLNDITPQEQIGQVLVQELPFSNTPTRPRYWAVDGTNIRFASPADQAYPIRFRYSQLFELSVANPTNSILTSYPDMYLFGALAEAGDYTFDDNSTMKWNTKFLDAVSRAQGQEASTNKNVPLRTELANSARQRFNINRGY